MFRMHRSSSISKAQSDNQDSKLDAFVTKMELANAKLLADFRAAMSKDMAEYKLSLEKSLNEVRLEMQQVKLICLAALAVRLLRSLSGH